jgi:excisionase family DNA binding protein
MPKAKESELSLNEVADRLGVHYMTAYRYVRTGKLAARQAHGEWRVRSRDLERFERTPKGSARRGERRWTQHAGRLYDRLLAGDEAGAWQVVERALAGGAEPSQIYVHALGPVLNRIGDEWAAGSIEVVDEHRASAVASRVVGRMGPLFARRGRRRGAVVLGSAPDDTHSLPVSMVADVLRGRGHRVVDLGGSTPPESFVAEATTADDLRAIGISAATTDGLRSATELIPLLRDELPPTTILLGGPAVATDDVARRAGADGWAVNAIDAGELVDAVTTS